MSLGDVFEEHLSLLSALQENYASSEDKEAILELIAIQNNTIASLKENEELAGKRVRGACRSMYAAERLMSSFSTNTSVNALMARSCSAL